MKLKFYVLIICLFSLKSFAQMKGLTESGDEIILYKNNTWKYVNDSINTNKVIKTNEIEFKTPKKSTFLVKSKNLKVGVHINPKNWSFQKNAVNDAAEFSFELKNEDLYGMMITEKVQIPLLSPRCLVSRPRGHW